MTVEIIYEDENIVAVNKPAGLVVHPDGKTREYALTDWIMEHYPHIKEVGEPAEYNGETVLRPGIVHRLDRETSGVLVIAKNQKAFAHLKEQFQGRTIRKTYYAFVYGSVKQDKGVIDRPIARSAKDFRLWSAQPGARGTAREAVTEYETEMRSESVSYLKLVPRTGRTHQLRVHLKAINHPIVCDRLYAPARALRADGAKRECILGFKRLALHAFCLELSLPGGSLLRLEAPLPEDFEKAIAKLKNL